jgi:hypothetical protein
MLNRPFNTKLSAAILSLDYLDPENLSLRAVGKLRLGYRD